MTQDPYTERYKRQLQLPGFGPAAQQKLSAATVLVVGAGGLGVPVLQYLTGMGVGRIEIMDGDLISYSNLHRQVLYQEAEVGLPKAIVAAGKLAAQNRQVAVIGRPVHLEVGNALDHIRGADLVVDATDNFSARYLINDACVLLGKPFIYGAVHQYEGHVSTFNYKDGPTYRCLYPVPPAAGEVPDCDLAGVLGIVPGLVGSYQALEAVRLLTGIGDLLSGKLLVFDFLHNRQYTLKLRPDPANKQLQQLQETYAPADCEVPWKKLSPSGLQQWMTQGRPFLLVDVRTEQAFQAGHLPHAVNWPVDRLGKGLPNNRPSGPVIVYCQKGNSSRKAAELLRRQQPDLQLYELSGGLDGWLHYLSLAP